MAENTKPLEAMSCAELLRELARLTTERDRDTATAMGDSAGTDVARETLVDERDQLRRVEDLIKAKGCDEASQ